ncbi:Hypothetical predicted protein [Mytilus galloprovincialis]|uniref:B box-type domain-containing protein n=1 Tax=Mytilus galloprovincialis TaxID=29158 RepID=A0A8B6FAY6_MYTGA|nr:Hypothetical predicted protein [Mytilus galloprovincialis]
MASSKPIQCEPCYTDKINTEADIWCYNCDAGLCSTCLNYHKRSYDHNTIDIKRYKNTTRAIKTECDKHGQQLNLYCLSHLMPCCDECIVTSHSNCTGVTSLAIVVDKTKIEKSKESIETDIKSILTLSEKLVTNKINNIKTGENQCVSMKEAINEIRSGINKHLDHLEEQFCIETDKKWNQEK